MRFTRLRLLIISGGILAASSLASAADTPKLLLTSGDIDPATAIFGNAGLPAVAQPESPDAPRTWAIQYPDKVGRRERLELESLGLEVVGYLPENALIVRGRDVTFDSARRRSTARWSAPLPPEWRVEPTLLAEATRRASGESVRIEVALWPGASTDRISARLAQLGATNVHARRKAEDEGSRLLFELPASSAISLASFDEVAWIEYAPRLVRRNDSTRWIVQSNVLNSEPLHAHGLQGQDQIIGHIDGEIDIDNCYFRDSTDNTPGDSHRKVKRVYYSPLGAESHGTHTAGTAAGMNVSGSTANMGVAPQAKLVHGLDFDVEGLDDLSASTLAADLERAHNDGARVHTNSWGDDDLPGGAPRTNYTLWCVDIDAFSHDFEDSLVIFAVSNLSTLRTPENAKNCLAVGACGDTPNQAFHGSGGQGPTEDGRRKPEVYAPGISTTSALASSVCSVTNSSGTSMAAPAVAGLGALVRQYYEDGFYPTGVATPADTITPTGALVKATLINSAVDMTGVTGYPSNREGWGRVLGDRALYFDGDTRTTIVRDVRNASGLETSDVTTITFEVDGSSEALQATLVWTDPEAAHNASVVLVNDLDLEVEAPDTTTYLGNNFSSGLSVSGGVADTVNNVEQVLLSAPATGTWTLRVRGSSVPMGPQGFAVVITGQVADPGTSCVPDWQLH